VPFRGRWSSDGYVYDHLFADGQVVEVGCWAHARRYFFKSLSTDPERANQALALIRELFKLERILATYTPEELAQARLSGGGEPGGHHEGSQGTRTRGVEAARAEREDAGIDAAAVRPKARSTVNVGGS